MLLRRWSAKINLHRVQEYEAFAADISLPMFRAHDGLVLLLMSREGPDANVYSIWREPADIDALEASPLYRNTAARLLSADFLMDAPSTSVQELHVVWIPEQGPRNRNNEAR